MLALRQRAPSFGGQREPSGSSRATGAGRLLLRFSAAAPYRLGAKGIQSMAEFERITFNPEVMGGRPCIRGMRVTVGMVVGMFATGRSIEEILELYPYLTREDVTAALRYAAWRAQEREIVLPSA
jgi:uncharacterized protein (DUF433 family)